jgi:hypothetical protein
MQEHISWKHLIKKNFFKIGENCIVRTSSNTRMHRTIRLKILFYIEVFASFLLTAFSDSFLPEQFLRDSRYFEQRINSNVTGYKDSFQVIVDLYSNLGITQASVSFRILEWLLFFVALLQCRSRAKSFNRETAVFVLSSFYLFFIPFYGSLFTKELLIVIILNAYFLLKKLVGPKYNLILLISLQLAIIILLRKYYLLTLGFMFVFMIVKQRLYKFRLLFPILLISLLSTIDARTQIFTRISSFEIFQIRNQTNEGLRIVARSRINQSNLSINPFENLQTFAEVMGQVVFPFQILSFSLYSIFTFLAVLVIGYALCSPYLLAKESRDEPEAIFLFAFFTTALIFEPDLGSYVRHGFVYIPLAISLLHKRSSNSVFGKRD